MTTQARSVVEKIEKWESKLAVLNGFDVSALTYV